MSGFTTSNTDHLIRTDIWQNQLKDVFEDDLMGTRYVKMIDGFPDGDRINIPSIGQMVATDYVENTPVHYSSFDTGNYTFTINQYKQVGTYVTDKMLQDSYMMSQVQSTFVPKMSRAIAEQIEAKVLAVGPEAQTSSDLNTINSAYHRYIGSGTSETMTVKDIHRARFALQKAMCPMTNLVGIVDPSVTYQLGQQANLVNLLTPDPQWQSIIKTGVSTGMRFMFNIAGFDIYESNWLKRNTSSETINGLTAAAGVHNLFTP